MTYTIAYSRRYEEQLRKLNGRDRSRIRDSIEVYLRHQPDVPGNKRKRLKPNPIAEWELR